MNSFDDEDILTLFIDSIPFQFILSFDRGREDIRWRAVVCQLGDIMVVGYYLDGNGV